MDVKLYKPKSEILRKYMIGFCFVNKGDEMKEYVIYPNNYTSLSISTEAVLHLREGVLGVSSIEKGPTTIAYISQYKEPIKIKYSSSPVNQLVLFFKPFGINHFISNISEYMPDVLTTQFSPFKDLEPTLECILAMENRSIQLEVIELYLLSIFLQQNDQFLHNVLEQVEKGIPKLDIAMRNNVTVPYVESHFQSTLGKSIVEYQTIKKQRHILQVYEKYEKHELLFFDDLFLRESELLKQIDSSETLDKLFCNLDFNPQRYWFIL